RVLRPAAAGRSTKAGARQKGDATGGVTQSRPVAPADRRDRGGAALPGQYAGCYVAPDSALRKNKGTAMTIAMRPLLAGVAFIAAVTTAGVGLLAPTSDACAAKEPTSFA